MYTLFSEKEVPSVKKDDVPENLASKLRGNWMSGINPQTGLRKPALTWTVSNTFRKELPQEYSRN